jgi:hypothetical protein
MTINIVDFFYSGGTKTARSEYEISAKVVPTKNQGGSINTANGWVLTSDHSPKSGGCNAAQIID